MADDDGLSGWRLVYAWISEVDPWPFIPTFGVGAVVSYLTDDLSPLTVGLATLFAMSLAFWLSRLIAAQWYRRKHGPPVLHVSAQSGGKGGLVLEHFGMPTVYRADGRIVRMNDPGAVNPAPQPFQCELLLMARTTSPEVTVRHEYWALIVVGSLIGGQLAIRRGHSLWNTVVPDSGVVVAYQIKSRPPLGAPEPERLYKVEKVGNAVIVTAL